VHYEALVQDQESVSRKLLAYCGLEWDARCLTFFENRRPVRTASTLQVRKPLFTKAVGRWQRYRAHLEPLLQALDAPADSATGPPHGPAPHASPLVPSAR